VIKKLKKIGFTVIIIGIVLNLSMEGFPYPQMVAAERETSQDIPEIEVVQSYTLMPLDEDREVPEGFTETTLSIEGEAIQAWSTEQEENEFYLVFAENESGESDFYRYDSRQGTLQRYADFGLVIEERYYEAKEEEEGESITTVLLGDFSSLMTVGLLSVIVLILTGVLTFMLIRRKKS